MPYIVDRDATSVPVRVRLVETVTADRDPIIGLVFNTTGLAAAYLIDGATEWVAITLTADNFLVSPGADGWYVLTLPNAAIVAGKVTHVRVATADNDVLYGFVASTGTKPPAPVAPVVQPPINFVFAIPGNDVVITAANNRVFIKETGLSVAMEANINVSAIPLMVIIENPDRTDRAIIPNADLTKVGTGVTFSLPSGITDEVGSYTVCVRHALSKRVYGSFQFSVVYAPHEDA